MSPPDLALPGDGLPDGCVEARAFHWTPARKAEVLRRVRRGELTAGQALSRFGILVEEYDSWVQAHRKFGQGGLKVTVRAPEQGRLL